MLESIIAKLLLVLGDIYGYDWDDLKTAGLTEYEIRRCKEIKEGDIFTEDENGYEIL